MKKLIIFCSLLLFTIYFGQYGFAADEYSNIKGSADVKNYDKQIKDLGINLFFAADSGTTDPAKNLNDSLNRCKSIVYRTLRSLPKEPVSHLKNLTLNFDENARRGLGGGSKIIVRCVDVSNAELAAVLTHEIGHIMDTGVLQGSSLAGGSGFMDGSDDVRSNDPSVQFYLFSFKDEKTLKTGASDLDFVSGYAMSDPFEDFAETYAYYLLHGNEFRKLAKSNKTLLQKYNFMKNSIFNGKEYFNGEDQNLNVLDRNYDVTVLPYNLSKFLVI